MTVELLARANIGAWTTLASAAPWMIAASLGPGGGKRAGDQVEDEAHSEAVTEPLEGVNGTAAELERGGSVAYEKCDPGGPYVVEGTLIAERRAELETFAEAGTSVAGVGLGDGRAHGEQAGRDERRGADLASERECFARQRYRLGRITGE